MSNAFRYVICLLFISSASFGQRFNTLNYNQSNGMPSNQVNELIQDRNGLIWIATMSGVVSFDGKSFNFLDNCPELSNNPIKSIYQDNKGNLWFGSIRKGLYKYSGTKLNSYTTENGLPSDIVNVVAGDESNGIWVGTNDGLSHFDGNRFVNYSVKNGLPSNIIYDVLTEKSGKVWVATANGISVLINNKFINYSSGVAGFNSNIVYCIEKINEDEICFGTYNGLSVLKDNKFTNYDNTNGLPNDRVSSLKYDQNGTLWIGTFGGGLV